MSLRVAPLVVWSSLLLAAPAAHAWDYEGHRIVNQLALAGLPAEFPDFAKTPAAAERIAFLAGEPDRWRNVADLPIKHFNSPDHYFDMDDLGDIGLPPASLGEFRYVFTAQLAAARAAHPEKFALIEPEKNKDHVRELVGFLPWAIAEHYGKLRSAFSYLKAYEEAGTHDEIANAQANAIYVMGVMGHYLGDGAQPLHTTKHHNGWVGENPHGYTRWTKFHAWIDGGFNQQIGLKANDVLPRVQPARLLPLTSVAGDARDPIFAEVMSYLRTQHALLEPLYSLEKAGQLKADGTPGSTDGRHFIEEQLIAGGGMLGSLWLTAWRSAPPDTYLRAQLLKRQAGR